MHRELLIFPYKHVVIDICELDKYDHVDFLQRQGDKNALSLNMVLNVAFTSITERKIHKRLFALLSKISFNCVLL